MKTVITMLVLSTLVFGCQQTNKTVDYKQLVQDELTNAVTGYYRTINIDTSYDTNWQMHAEATVEFINKQGGIERTNLPFYFITLQKPDNTPVTSAVLDEPKITEENFQADLERNSQTN